LRDYKINEKDEHLFSFILIEIKTSTI